MRCGFCKMDIINFFWESLLGGDDIYKANER